MITITLNTPIKVNNDQLLYNYLFNKTRTELFIECNWYEDTMLIGSGERLMFNAVVYFHNPVSIG